MSAATEQLGVADQVGDATPESAQLVTLRLLAREVDTGYLPGAPGPLQMRA
jgi:hypothetical protein